MRRTKCAVFLTSGVCGGWLLWLIYREFWYQIAYCIGLNFTYFGHATLGYMATICASVWPIILYLYVTRDKRNITELGDDVCDQPRRPPCGKWVCRKTSPKYSQFSSHFLLSSKSRLNFTTHVQQFSFTNSTFDPKPTQIVAPINQQKLFLPKHK